MTEPPLQTVGIGQVALPGAIHRRDHAVRHRLHLVTRMTIGARQSCVRPQAMDAVVRIDEEHPHPIGVGLVQRQAAILVAEQAVFGIVRSNRRGRCGETRGGGPEKMDKAQSLGSARGGGRGCADRRRSLWLSGACQGWLSRKRHS